MKINITGGAARVLYQAQAPDMILSTVSNTSPSPVLPNDDHLSPNVMILVAVACVLSVFLSTVLLFFFFPRFRGWLEMANQLFARHMAPLSIDQALQYPLVDIAAISEIRRACTVSSSSVDLDRQEEISISQLNSQPLSCRKDTIRQLFKMLLFILITIFPGYSQDLQ
ncbi:uncharacterized protein ARMOST_10507 [Armillaria ostoyae]|uniref:Uncharacterized protein n=1 Tax=Armillaria ostoyae TaxID=47428 RepID=A0A284REK1_ARMOS|nr:uncharacterized protein ARMOST_10507 [Armillaria ostoyae]